MGSFKRYASLGLAAGSILGVSACENINLPGTSQQRETTVPEREPLDFEIDVQPEGALEASVIEGYEEVVGRIHAFFEGLEVPDLELGPYDPQGEAYLLGLDVDNDVRRLTLEPYEPLTTVQAPENQQAVPERPQVEAEIEVENGEVLEPEPERPEPQRVETERPETPEQLSFDIDVALDRPIILGDDRYRVEKGDTLYGIAENLLVSNYEVFWVPQEQVDYDRFEGPRELIRPEHVLVLREAAQIAEANNRTLDDIIYAGEDLDIGSIREIDLEDTDLIEDNLLYSPIPFVRVEPEPTVVVEVERTSLEDHIKLPAGSSVYAQVHERLEALGKDYDPAYLRAVMVESGILEPDGDELRDPRRLPVGYELDLEPLSRAISEVRERYAQPEVRPPAPHADGVVRTYALAQSQEGQFTVRDPRTGERRMYGGSPIEDVTVAAFPAYHGSVYGATFGSDESPIDDSILGITDEGWYVDDEPAAWDETNRSGIARLELDVLDDPGAAYAILAYDDASQLGSRDGIRYALALDRVVSDEPHGITLLYARDALGLE